MKRVPRLEIIIVALVLLASLVARVTTLDAFRVADELHWICRTISFRAALLRGIGRTPSSSVIRAW